jgi:hypothetical protein
VLTQYASPNPDGWLADVELLPDEADHKSASPIDKEAGVLLTERGRRNRVQVGVPQVVDVLAAWPSDERLGAEITATQRTHAFLSVRLACSVLPDRGCRFTSLLWVVRLESTDGPAPVAVDIFPREVADTRQFSRSYGVTGKLSFAFTEASIEGKQDEQVLRYEPRITASGLLTDAPAWSFDSTSQRPLRGILETFLLVKAPRGAPVRVGFALEGEVRTAFGPIPLRRYRRPDLLTASYDLTETPRG